MTGFATVVQRYYASLYGRFNTPDQSSKSMRPKKPASWNRYAYVLDDPINRMDPTGNCDWNAFVAGAATAISGGITVTVATGLYVGTSGLAAVATAGVLISGTAAAVAGAASMIGACTGMSSAQLSLLINASNPGGAISIAFMGVLTDGNTNTANDAQVGAFLFDAGSGVFTLQSVIPALMNDTATLGDLGNYMATVLTAMGDALSYDPSNPLMFVYTPPMNVGGGGAPDVPYDPSDIGDVLVDQ